MNERYKIIQRDNQTVWLADLINCQVLGKYHEEDRLKAQGIADVLDMYYEISDNRLQKFYEKTIFDNYDAQMGRSLANVEKGDLVIWKHSADVYTTEIVQDTYRDTHIIVQNRKFRRLDGREVGVRQGTQEWYYCCLKQFDQRILDDEEFVKQHRAKIKAIQNSGWSKMLSRDVDEIYTFLKSKGVIE